MALVEGLTVKQAAETLGVSAPAVHKLLQRGQLQGERVGNLWLLSPADVATRAALQPRRGRPLSPAAAWALIDELNEHAADRVLTRSNGGHGHDGHDGHDRNDGHDGHDGLPWLLRRRAERRAVRVHESRLDDVNADRAVVLGGVHAADAAGGPVMVRPPFDVYVRGRDLRGFDRRFQPRPSADEPNLFVHVVDDAVWPYRRARVTGVAEAWLDLVEQRDRAAPEVQRLLFGPPSPSRR